MSEMNLYDESTQFTNARSSILVEDSKIFQVTERTRVIQSPEQLDRIIENLTLQMGFMLDSDQNKFIVLKSPVDSETTYVVDHLVPNITKVTKRFLGNVE